MGIDPLGGLPRPRTLIASGDSQSSARLSIYINSVHLLDPIYAFVQGGPLGGLPGPLGSPIREDSTDKVFKVISEWDLLAAEWRVRRPDTDRYVAWEVAGSSHSDYHNFVYNSPVRMRDVGVPGLLPGTAQCIDPTRSRVNLYLVHHAAYEHTARWIDKGTQPPAMPSPLLISDSSTDPPTLERDRFGIAVGGIRLPDVTVPTATNTGWNTGGHDPALTGACQQAGTHRPFDQATLDALYPTHKDYVSRVVRATRENIRQGYLLKEDGAIIIRAAFAAPIGDR
jgi:hypothetical protein